MSNDCNEEIAGALGRDETNPLTARELGAIKRQASKLNEQIKADPASAQKILSDFLAQREEELQGKRLSALKDAQANDRQLARWDASTMAHLGERLTSKFVGTLKDFLGGKNSLGVLIGRESQERASKYLADLHAGGLLDYAMSRSDSLNMRKARMALEQGKDPSQFGPKAAAWAKITKQHQDRVNAALMAEGIPRGKIDDFALTQSHDSWSLARAGGNWFGSTKARDYWASKVLQSTDWNRSFGGEFANADGAARTARLRSVYSQFVAGKHLSWSSDNPGKSREIHFVSPEAAQSYHEEFGGNRSLGEQVMHEVSRGGKNLAIAREWGPGAEANIHNFMDTVLKTHVEGSPEYQQLAKAHTLVKDQYLPSLLGQLTNPSNGAAMFLAKARTILSAAKIGASIAVMPGDLALNASNAMRYGNGKFWSTLAQSTGDMFSGLSKDDSIRLAAANGIQLNGFGLPMNESMRDYAGPSSINAAILKYGAHNAWTDHARVNTLTREGFNDWYDRGKTFEQLSESRQRGLRTFGITPAEWDVIRQQEGLHLPSVNQRAFTADGVRALPHEKFQTLAPAADEKGLKAVREDLAIKYRNLHGEMADRATVAPSEEMKAITLLGTKSGTIAGETVRAVNEIKGFLYNYTRNHVMGNIGGFDGNPEAVGIGHMSWRFATGRAPGRAFLGLANLMAAGVGLGAIENTFSDVITGKTPENPMYHPQDFFLRAFARQSAGVYSDIILGQSEKPNPTWTDYLGAFAGPQIETAGELGAAVVDAGKQVTKGAFVPGYSDKKMWAGLARDGRDATSTVYHSIPGNNLAWTKAITDYYLYDNLMELENPGYKQRLSQRLQKERGQSLILGGGQ